MKILVTAKRVEDPDANIVLTPDGSDIERDDLDDKINPFCEIAVEEALRIVESEGGEVVAVTLGEVQKSLSTALAMGANRGIFVEVDEHDLDADLVARVLCELAREEEPDLFLLGKQATDGDGHEVGQRLAEHLGWPQATCASKIEYLGDHIRVEREVDAGREVVELPLPAVVTTDLRLNTPRYPTLPSIMKAKRKPIDHRELDDFSIDHSLKVETVGYAELKPRTPGHRVANVEELIAELKASGKLESAK